MAASHNGIEVAVFDIGNVIFRFGKGISWLSELLNAPEEQVRRSWLAVDNIACRGKIDVQEVWSLLANEYRYTGASVRFLEEWSKNFSPIQETHEFLQMLSTQIAVGLLTNVYSGGFDEGISNGSIPNINYRFVVQSCNVGFVKPEPEIYVAAEESSGVAPSQLLLVDDLEPNIKMAKQRGWRGILFKPDDPLNSIMEIKKELGMLQ